MPSRRVVMIGLCLAAGLGAGPSTTGRVSFTREELRRIRRHSPLGPPPRDPTNRVWGDPAAAHLGRFLFFDKRLSSDGSVSCATCHDPARGLSDGRQLARGLQTITRHSPTLWNVAYNRWFFWDGRADSLWAQALGPIEHPLEMGFDRLRLAHLLCADGPLRRAYTAIFGPLPDLAEAGRFPPAGRPIPTNPEDPLHRAWSSMRPEDRTAINVVFTNVGKALAAYETLLVSRHSAFDRFVEGLETGEAEKLAALSAAAQRGLRLFVGRAGCRLCHSGPNFSDGEFHDTRVPPLGPVGPREAGRFAGVEKVLNSPFNAAGPYSDDRSAKARVKIEFLTNVQENWGRFKTPSLRNVARTAPYMHQGQFATLRDVLHYYSTLEGALPPGHHQESILKPLRLEADEIADLLAFLEALTDEEVAPHLLRAPASPIFNGP